MLDALLIAHGSPRAPDGPEAALAGLAHQTAARLPGARVASATLAVPEALPAALRCLEGGRRLVVVPHFMSDGWMARQLVPERLRALTDRPFELLRPFGLWPATRALCARRALEATRRLGAQAAETTVVLAAHGSPSDARPGAAARDAAGVVAQAGGFRAVTCGFIDEQPSVAAAARTDGPALCLPFFAQRAGHVLRDLPAALAEAGFDGPLLDPVGQDPGVPDLIAGQLREAVTLAA